MATLRDYYNTGGDNYESIGNPNVWRAQTFTISASYILTSVKLLIYREGSPGDLIVSVQGVDGSGHPDDSDLTSYTYDTTGLTTNIAGEWITITFATSVTLAATTKYAIVLKAVGGSAGNVVRWKRDGTSPTYTGGNLEITNSGAGNWAASATNDMMFETWGGTSPIVDKTYSKQLVTVGNYEVWYESSAGTMAELAAANGDINTSLPLQIFEGYGKVFVVNKTNLKIADFINISIATADLGANPPTHGMVLTGGSSTAKMVVDYITNLDDNEACTIYGKRITTATFTTGETVTNTVASVSFAMTAANEVAGPFWYDWTTFGNAAGDDTTFGDLPDNATIGCLYRGRAVLSGDVDYPHQWYMMRQANPFDALYGTNDAQSAVAGGNSDAGEIGDIVVALIPYKDDYLIFGCASSMWLLIGDPCEGGTLAEFDLNTGIFGAKSFCWDSEGNLYFWGTNGIYKSAVPGKPVCISEINLPKLVKDEAVDVSTHRITMGFDRRRNGITICITVLADGTNSNYFLDLRSGGFFPESYPEECGIFSQFQYEAVDPTYRKLIMGCNDGYLRIFDDSVADDDIGASDEAINSYVTFGPLLTSDDPLYEGKITGLNCITAGGAIDGSQSDSDDIECKIFLANSAEKIIEQLSANSAPKLMKIIKAPGRQRGGSIKRKLRGVYTGIRLGNNTATEKWGFEQLLIDAKKAGRFK